MIASSTRHLDDPLGSRCRELNNPIWPDAQPWDNLMIAVIAVILVWLKRRTMFQRGAGVTDILMPGMPE